MKKSKTYYLVGAVEKTHKINTLPFDTDLKLTWADGMVGVMPVFTNKAKALKYANKKFKIFTFEVVIENDIN